MSRVRILLAVSSLVIAASGCYQPAIEPCKVVCASAEACPAGLVCNNGGRCALSMMQSCTDDGGVLPDTPCGWPNISNLDACALNADMATVVWEVPANTVSMINTDAPSATGGNGGLVIEKVAQRSGLPMVALIKVRSLTVEAMGRIEVRGSLPLVILVDGTATISGEIRIEPVPGYDDDCPGRGLDAVMTALAVGTGGGGGGSFGLQHAGAPGGTGGAVEMSAGGLGGDAATGIGGGLSPLRPGCQGGRGGRDPGAALAETRGLAGGAIQIAARTSLTITGRISAAGGGGRPNSASHRGAGGGGSGGAILLEAPELRMPAAELCANGGGGGGTGAIGSPGTCTTLGAPGGGGSGSGSGAALPGPTSTGGSGGRGATELIEASAGLKGHDGSVYGGAGYGMDEPGGGGGGGGGVGRIRINGTILNQDSILLTPSPTRP